MYILYIKIMVVCFSPNNTYLISGSADKTTRIYDI